MNRRQFDRIEFFNGTLILVRCDIEQTFFCPFSSSHQHCGKWCIHCGDAKREVGTEGTVYSLVLTCGSGLVIEAKEFRSCSLTEAINGGEE